MEEGMAICICGDSSKRIFERLTSEERGEAYYVEADDVVFEVPDETTAQDLAIDIWGDASLGIDILVRRHRDRRSVPGLRQHVVGTAITHRSLIKLPSGIIVTSPWFELLRSAPSMSMVELSIRIMQLTSFFRLNPKSNDGFDECAPSISWLDLDHYIASSKGTRGVKRVREAMGWCCPRARSPREIDLTLLLCMPFRYGGCGLPVPELNREVAPGELIARVLGEQTCFVDHYWEPVTKQAMACGTEYLGKDRHPNLGDDLTRVYAMRMLGIKLLLVADEQLKDAHQMLVIAQEIAKTIGYRPRGGKWPSANRLQSLIDEIVAH